MVEKDWSHRKENFRLYCDRRLINGRLAACYRNMLSVPNRNHVIEFILTQVRIRLGGKELWAGILSGRGLIRLRVILRHSYRLISLRIILRHHYRLIAQVLVLLLSHGLLILLPLCITVGALRNIKGWIKGIEVFTV